MVDFIRGNCNCKKRQSFYKMPNQWQNSESLEKCSSYFKIQKEGYKGTKELRTHYKLLTKVIKICISNQPREQTVFCSGFLIANHIHTLTQMCTFDSIWTTAVLEVIWKLRVVCCRVLEEMYEDGKWPSNSIQRSVES